MEDLTIIYYSSNREDEAFEEKVRQNILDVSNGLPIISVTQKPIDFGRNICVGDVGTSGFNMFRQVQIALQNCNTKYVISAEADCLYPPDYFTALLFDVESDICYRNTNLYVMAHKRPIFWRKREGATHAQVINKDFYLKRLYTLFQNAPEWSTEEKNFPRERGLGIDIFDEKDILYYKTENPVVQIKTSDSMRHHTHSERKDIYNIRYWGDAVIFRNKYLCK